MPPRASRRSAPKTRKSTPTKKKAPSAYALLNGNRRVDLTESELRAALLAVELLRNPSNRCAAESFGQAATSVVQSGANKNKKSRWRRYLENAALTLAAHQARNFMLNAIGRYCINLNGEEMQRLLAAARGYWEMVKTNQRLQEYVFAGSIDTVLKTFRKAPGSLKVRQNKPPTVNIDFKKI